MDNESKHEPKTIIIRASELKRGEVGISGTRRTSMIFEGEECRVAILTCNGYFPDNMVRGMIGRTGKGVDKVAEDTLVILHRDDWANWRGYIHDVETSRDVFNKVRHDVRVWKDSLRSEVSDGMSDHDVATLVDNIVFTCAQLISLGRDTPANMYDVLKRHDKR